MSNLLESVPLRWVVAVVAFPIGGYLGHLIASPAATAPAAFVSGLVAGAIIAPIGEELLFRAFATTAWAREYGPRRALIQGALFFALVHVLTVTGSSAGEAVALAIVGFVTRIPVALALGWLFLRRGSIWAPIGLHATFNAILLILAETAAAAQ